VLRTTNIKLVLEVVLKLLIVIFARLSTINYDISHILIDLHISGISNL